VRVIAGALKGRTLKAPSWDGLRPTSDRLRETLFNVIAPRIVGARVLDVYAGTGAIGIEALSRGARHVTFVEKAGQAVDILRQNLKATRLEAGAQVERADVFRYLEQTPREPFDLIYIAPPQYQGLWLKTLQAVDDRPAWLASGGQVVVQIFPKEYVEPNLRTLTLIDERRYGSVMLLFYALAAEVDDPDDIEA